MNDDIALIQAFMAGVRSVTLYPVGHPSRKAPQMNLFRQVEKFLGEWNRCEIAIREDVLTVNDEPLFDTNVAADDLYDWLRQFELTTIRFLPGVDDASVGVFLELVASEDDGLGKIEQVDLLLKQSGVETIEVENEEDLTGKAVRVYSEATDYMRGLWQESRLGKIPKGDEAVSLIDDMSAIMAQDRSPLVGLTMLSDYDNYTFNHSVNVGVFAMALAEEFGYGAADVKTVGLGGLLHDVGKTQVPLEIINKPGKLDGKEWEMMQRHPVFSGELVQQMGLNQVFDIVYQHHCGWNRQGYPRLPDGKELSEGAMMTAVVDVYDSMTTTRPYQRCFTPQESIAVIMKLRDKEHLQKDIVESFLRTLGIYPVGTCIRLNNGSVAFVNAVYRGEEERPVVKIFRSAQGELLRESEEIDLREAPKLSIVGTLDPSQYGVKAASYVDPAPVMGS